MGDAARDALANALRNAGREVETEVVKKTPLGIRRIDIEVRQGGNPIGGIEDKTGCSRYTPLQRLKDAWLRATGYIVDLVRF